MDVHEIQDKLNILLEGTERKIAFWYDDDGSYSDEIDQLQLTGKSKVIRLTGKNNFATKLLLEHQDLTTSYLVYAPFARPEDKENSLADIFYYSEHFYSDKIVQMMGDLNIPVECQDEVKLYKKFWAGSNLQKFKDLKIEKYTVDSIDIGILCVLAGTKTLSFEEMLRRTILAGLIDNSVLKKYENLKIDGVFWRLCEKQYGYKDSNPTLQKFLTSMIVTYIDAQMNGNEPKAWKTLTFAKKNDAVVFVKNLMSNDETKSLYDDFTDKLAGELDVINVINQIPLEDVKKVDRAVFPVPAIAEKYPMEEPSRLTSDNDERRIRAIAVSVLEYAAENGHTIMPCTNLSDAMRELTLDPVCAVTPDIIKAVEKFMLPVIMKREMKDGTEYYKLVRMQEFDDIIERRISRRLNAPRLSLKADWRALLDSKFDDEDRKHGKAISITEQEERARQEKAAILDELAQSRISVLVGDAGTGKTTVLSVLCSHPEIKAGGVLLLAPTGKATVRLLESMGEEGRGFTALNVAQFLVRSNRFDFKDMRYILTESDYADVPDTVIIDEASMLTEEMFGALMQAFLVLKKDI